MDCENHGSIALAKNSRLSPLPPERAGFNYGIGETVDIPIDGSGDLKKRERELQAKEAELRKCEEIVKRKEDAAARGIMPCLYFAEISVVFSLFGVK
ncbi:secretory carrier-associated membrane protein 5-like [Rosa chinensis]|uniref:secretory carrier-associated membrane protein 5-like n=1 Tax=Rosa chinensis TaxID=74649 RepID=UPI001AD8D72B|nr:secretory carrier-associated membrane protein 5-like [Rosa chinensis]